EISENLQFSLPEKSVWVPENINLHQPEITDKKAEDFIFDTVYRKSPLSRRVTAKLKKIF
ncbi:MAG: hypothetical protein J6T08_01650, partial [Lentisphaeria bacterium]|nr:hypothetical protein [Lentisphaeria bacterium]